METFGKVLKSMIKRSGGSIDKVDLRYFIELLSNSFMFNPWNYWLGVIIQKNPLDIMIDYHKRPPMEAYSKEELKNRWKNHCCRYRPASSANLPKTPKDRISPLRLPGS